MKAAGCPDRRGFPGPASQQSSLMLPSNNDQLSATAQEFRCMMHELHEVRHPLPELASAATGEPSTSRRKMVAL